MNLWQRFRQWLQGEQNVYYIGGSDVLPPPLKGEAERQAIEHWWSITFALWFISPDVSRTLVQAWKT